MSYLYQPYLDSETQNIPIKDNAHSGTPTYKTVSEILQYITSLSLGNSFYTEDLGYSSKGMLIIPFWSSNVVDLYLGDKDLHSGESSYPVWIASDAAQRNDFYKSIYCNNGSFYYDTLSGDWGSTIIDGRSYRKANDSNTSGYGNYATIYFNSNYDNIYINNQPPITYAWHSVKSISGSLGTFSFTSLPDEVLTGEAITGLRQSDFDIWSDQTSFFGLTTGLIADASPVPVMYSGDECYCNASVVRDTMLKTRFQYYVQSQLIFDYTGAARLFSVRWAFMIDYENQVAKAVLVTPYDDAGFTFYNYTPFSMTDAQMEAMYIWLTASNPEDDPNYNHEEEGTGVDPWHDTEITGLTVPGKSAIDTGFTSMYEVSPGQLQSLSRFLWSKNFVDNVSKFFNDPREIIIGVSIMPINPDVGSSKEIVAGGISTGISGMPLTSQYKLVNDFGSIYVKKSKGNFLDYPPYTKITAHLPYVGDHSLDVNDVMGKTLTLSYLFDFLSGACIACIKANGKPRYFFGGSCGTQVPTSSEDFSRTYSSILSAGATIGASLATIATGGLTAPLAIGAGSNMLANGMNMTPNVQYSSGSGGINGLLASQTAYLVVETPKEKVASGQGAFTGKPSFVKKQLEDISGFVKCFKVHLDKFGGTETERNAAEQMLLDGVRIEKNGTAKPSYTPTSETVHGLIFAKLQSDTDVIGKTWTDENTIEGKPLFDIDILKPKFVIKGNVSIYNYVYIPDFDRFYYIDAIQAKTGDLMEISLSCDILQSHAEDILDNYAILERSESNYNDYFNDAQYWTKQDKDISIVPFKTSAELECAFGRSNNTFILTLAGS